MTDERATIATVQATVDGLSKLVERGLEDIQRQLNAVASVPIQVAALRSDHDALVKRVDRLEQGDDRGPDRRIQIAAMIVTALVGIGVIIIAIIQLTQGVGHG